MFGFHLVPVDGGAPVHVPPGDTVLGRGPLLTVSDRRISRHHAVLQNLDGKLRLKPTHLNPCFIQSSLTDDPRPLVKDSWWPLRHGDVFSLLPGQFVYRVAAVGGASNRNGHKEKQEEEELSHSPQLEEEPNRSIRVNCGQTPPHEESPGLSEKEEEPSPNRRLNDQEDKTVREEVKDDNDEGDDRGGASSVMRTRVLPVWMMAVVATPHGSSPKPKVVSVKRSTASKQATPPAADSPVEAELSEEEEQRPRKKRRRKVRDISDEEEKTEATPTAAIDSATTTRASDSEPEDNRKSSVPTPSKRQLRTPCPYGRDCYRKNPVHFQECSHPEDTDYEDEEQGTEQGTELDRPECPYGTDCYRKNPLHRKEFRHTRTAARTTRTAPKKSPAHDEDEDDSFIDDGSEDAGDDSDYVPPDSEDSGREDVHRLQKEAKMFLQSRK
ncbi:aprataxin and PNK-like factor [Solea solea]|uniref:aprataxin and PNK-like factor n=1 Tax=Solea solea TaxID=90069 RepID=UPI00272AAE27|nr:aprataxin and PNK-like factor [Solea solea]